jgi:hypothetical protein
VGDRMDYNEGDHPAAVSQEEVPQWRCWWSL